MSGLVSALPAFVFGTALGSFLNVVILRYPAEGPLGRSRCPHCRQTLQWYELIPVVSFLLQRGLCRHCRRPLSRQYPLVELAMGVATAALFTPLPADRAGLLLTFLAAGMIALLLILFVIDLRTMLLPDLFIVILTLFAGVHVALRVTSYGLPVTNSLWGAAIG